MMKDLREGGVMESKLGGGEEGRENDSDHRKGIHGQN